MGTDEIDIQEATLIAHPSKYFYVTHFLIKMSTYKRS